MFQYRWSFGGTNWITSSAPFTPNGTYHHVALTYDGSSTSNDPVIYVDGIPQTLDDASPGGTRNNDSGDNLIIGIGIADVNEYDGRIDEIRVYNRALSASEIEKLYRSGAVKVNSSENLKLTNGLIAMWSFNGPDITDNQILDVSGNGKHGGLINGATSSAKTIGKVGQALSFDGVNDYIKTNFGPSLTDMTIATWVYLDDSPTAEENVIGAYDNDANGSLMQITLGLGTTVTTPQMYVGDAQGFGDYDIVTSSASLETRRWHHIAAVHDADGRNIIYVDGADTVNDAATSKSDGSMDFSGQPFTIGARNLGTDGGPNTFFDGKIDEMRVYNRALSASEVKQLYLTGVKIKP